MMKKQETISTDRLMEVMYNMFLEGALPDLDMEDFEVMWKALMYRWGIELTDEEWEAFINEINSKASDRYDWFKETFKKYFI